jgi:type II secretory pathway pseudopilin PulG
MMRMMLRNPKSEIRNPKPTCRKAKGFSLVEAVAAVTILALVSAGVVVIINRCIASAADSQQRMQAFEIARENMEKLLATYSVSETSDSGASDKYPEIKWQTAIETFYEPITSRMWVRAVCSAEYIDTEGKEQTVELTHWLTDVTKEQLLQIMANKEKEKKEEQETVADKVLPTVEEAAAYAGVDVETVQKWVENGMVTLQDGSFVKNNLDLYKESNGNPPPRVKDQQIKSELELTKLVEAEQEAKPEQEPKTAETEPGISKKHIYTADELRGKGFPEELIPMCLQLLNSD